MRKSLKSLLTVLFVFALSYQLFAADGVVTFVKGKVEVKRGSGWVSLKVGDKFAQSEMINTGFQSEAKVKLMDSVLYLGPVTRVTLDTLSSSSDRDKVNVYLSTGTVRSKVSHSGGKRTSYTVRTPIAVASVRGTDFSVDDSNRIETYEGAVAVSTVRAVYGDRNDADDDDADDDDEEDDDEAEDSGSDDAESSEASSDEDSSDNAEKDSDTGSDNAEAGDVASEAAEAPESDEGSNAPTASDSSDLADTTSSSSSEPAADSSSGKSPAPAPAETKKPEAPAYNSFEDSVGVPEGSKSSVVVTANKGTQVLGSAGGGAASASVAPVKHSIERKSSSIVSSITTEGTKQASKVEVPISTAVNNVVSGGNVGTPKTGSINIQIKQPSSGNVSVEVVLPR